MNAESSLFYRCLTLLQKVVPYQYGQWVIEDPDSHDYSVIASVIPKGEEGYSTAHRTGIIGQVFRTEKSILARDVRNHPLYDPFDDSIDWELCFPVFLDGKLKAVVNLEGGGPLEIGDSAWERVCQIVEETTQCQPPPSIAEANNLSLIKTRRIVIRASHDDDRVSNLVEMARAIARGGKSTLLVGDYPDLLRGRGPTIAEASKQGLGASYCFFGVETRLDLLATGPLTQGEILENCGDWWDVCKGRYAFVLENEALTSKRSDEQCAESINENRRTWFDPLAVAGSSGCLVGSDQVQIQKLVLDAVSVMFSRAAANNPDKPEIKDAKEVGSVLPNSGNLQDCEFGMTLLIVNKWFQEDGLERDFVAHVPKSDFQRVVIALVARVVERVLRRQYVDEGGEGNQISFFSGEPYTQYREGRIPKYSANLDAAMITLAFLAPAVEQFNEELASLNHGLEDAELPSWVKSQRDAALCVILDGLNYAKDCRVVNDGTFQGFTSDPCSNAARPQDGGIERNHDRLFFAWTACETINDMKSWRESYLDRYQGPTAPPDEAVSQIRLRIKELEKTLDEAAEWCEVQFFPELEKLEIKEWLEFVGEVEQSGGGLPENLVRSVEELETSVQYVYHLSQYATLRSFAPQSISIKEIRLVADKLDQLVSRSIRDSRLDQSSNEELFRTLTRVYSLGISNPWGYSDDAWYPLVVGSLSNLFSRTIDEMESRFARSDVVSLMLIFQRSLEAHVYHLVSRRAGVVEDGDRQLWSFAEGQPYVLYATQRTILALIHYSQFLRTAQRFENEPTHIATNPISSSSIVEAILGELASKLESPESWLRLLQNVTEVRAPHPTTQPVSWTDAELAKLGDRVLGLSQNCNRLCDELAGLRLFDPTHKARSRLFSLIQSPVQSEPDFVDFIIAVHNVFDESVPWAIKRQEPTLAEPFAEVAETFHKEASFSQLRTLRNKLVHDDQDAAWELSVVVERLIGVRIIAKEDGSTWLRLQKAVLERLAYGLDALLQVLERHKGRIGKDL